MLVFLFFTKPKLQSASQRKELNVKKILINRVTCAQVSVWTTSEEGLSSTDVLMCHRKMTTYETVKGRSFNKWSRSR